VRFAFEPGLVKLSLTSLVIQMASLEASQAPMYLASVVDKATGEDFCDLQEHAVAKSVKT